MRTMRTARDVEVRGSDVRVGLREQAHQRAADGRDERDPPVRPRRESGADGGHAERGERRSGQPARRYRRLCLVRRRIEPGCRGERRQRQPRRLLRANRRSAPGGDASGSSPGMWTTRFIHGDGLGSVRALTDETGTTIDTRGYEAFGTKNVEAGSDPLSYGFAGEPFEPNSMLAYHRARWMDAGWGGSWGWIRLTATTTLPRRCTGTSMGRQSHPFQGVT